MREEDRKLNIEYLNSIDLPKPMYHEEICEYMERADWFANKNKLPKELKGELFRFLDEDDVSGYLYKRFNVLTVDGRII
jgi:hypothetical protein